MVNQLKSEAMKSIIYIGLLLLTLTSCQEDKGNYTYRNINEISVTGIAATKTVTQFSILGMSPVINQTMPVSADDLEYLWYVDRGNGKIDTLSQELNIQTPVNLYPYTYEAYFVVIQKSTGIFTKVPFKLVVESQLGQGLLVLSDLNGYANLAYWERSGEVVQDVYEKVNPGLHLGRNPYRVCYMFKGYSIPAFVTVMCHDEQGGCALNPVDFTKFKDYAELFYQTPDPLHPDGYGYSNYFNYDETAFGDLYNDFIINNGQLHERSTYVGWYQPAYAVDQDYRLSEYTFMGMMQYIFYDNEHSQFLQKTSWPPNSFSVVEVPEGYFRDLYLVYADRGFAGTDYPHYYCVFKEKTTSDHYFVEVLMSPSGFKPLKKEKIGFAVQEDMPFAVSFTTSAIFYGVGNELYCYDTGNGRSVSCYNEFGSGAEITALYLVPQYGESSQYPGETVLSAVKLFVGVSLPGQEREGSVFEFEVNLDNTLTFIRKKEHIAGKIVSMTWKY